MSFIYKYNSVQLFPVFFSNSDGFFLLTIMCWHWSSSQRRCSFDGFTPEIKYTFLWQKNNTILDRDNKKTFKGGLTVSTLFDDERRHVAYFHDSGLVLVNGPHVADGRGVDRKLAAALSALERLLAAVRQLVPLQHPAVQEGLAAKRALKLGVHFQQQVWSWGSTAAALASIVAFIAAAAAAVIVAIKVRRFPLNLLSRSPWIAGFSRCCCPICPAAIR